MHVAKKKEQNRKAEKKEMVPADKLTPRLSVLIFQKVLETLAIWSLDFSDVAIHMVYITE